MSHCIVVGAGPVGATTALALARQGLDVTLVEKEATPPDEPRAATVQPPTLDMFQELGVAESIVDQGLQARHFQFRERSTGEIISTFDYGRLSEETAFPFALQCEQVKIARAVLAELERCPNVRILMNTQLVDLAQDADGVDATLSDGETLRGDFLVGCDGGRSFVRKSLGIAFEGFTYPERFLVLTTATDLSSHGYTVRNYVLDPEQWCALFKVPHAGPPGLWRCVFPVRADVTDTEALRDPYIASQIEGLGVGLGLGDVGHRNLYTVNQRVAETFRKGRALLAGDAAHVNNPLGGLGMNSGIHDGVNLADKIRRATDRPQDRDTLLDQYDAERRTLAIEFVQAQTIQNKKRLESRTAEERAAARDALARSAEHAEKHKAWVMQASLISSLRTLNSQGQAA